MAAAPVDESPGASPRRPPIESRRVAGLPPATTPRSTATDGTVDELAIVSSILRGDVEGFRVLVDRETASVIRACYRVLGDMHEAEDVAQEAFVSAYRSLSTWRGEGPFAAWLTRIAVRLAVRQAGRRRPVTWLRSPQGGEADDATASLPAGPHTQPEQLALRAERATAARQAVAALDEPYREVVALRYFGERSLEEIASITGRPLSTVKTHLRRGLLRLRDQVELGALA